MAKFCGNCGNQADDSANVCGNCGTPFGGSATNTGDFYYVDPEKREKFKKKAIKFGSIGVAIIAVIIAIWIISGFVGYRGVVRKFVNSIEDFDDDVIESITCGYYLEFMDDNDLDIDEVSPGVQIGSIADYLEEEIGGNYDIDYEINDSYEMKNRKFRELKERLEDRDYDTDEISEAMVVELEITAESKRDEEELECELTLIKEDGSWKVYYAEIDR